MKGRVGVSVILMIVGCSTGSDDGGRSDQGSGGSRSSDSVPPNLSGNARPNDDFLVRVTSSSETICRGSCARLVASVADAGAPYEYSWAPDTEDRGSAVTVCPLDTTTYTVTVGDRASSTAEISSIRATGTARITIAVRQCSPDERTDAGRERADAASGGSGGRGGPRDAAAPPTDTSVRDGRPTSMGIPCFENPSFEGMPIQSTPPPHWSTCSFTPDTDPGYAVPPPQIMPPLPAPVDGSTYLGLIAGHDNLGNRVEESVGQMLCMPVQVGTPYAFSISAANWKLLDVTASDTWLELWGGFSVCDQRELLWTSPHLLPSDAWRTLCVSFRPKGNYTSLSLIARTPNVTGMEDDYVIVDAITPTEACR